MRPVGAQVGRAFLRFATLITPAPSGREWMGMGRYPGRCPGLYSFAPSGHHGSPHSASRTAPKLPCTIKHLRSEIPRDAAVRSEIPIRKKNGQVRVPPITVAPTPRDARNIREVAKAMSGVLDSHDPAGGCDRGRIRLSKKPAGVRRGYRVCLCGRVDPAGSLPLRACRASC